MILLGGRRQDVHAYESMYPSLHVHTMEVETVCAENFGDPAHWVCKASDCNVTHNGLSFVLHHLGSVSRVHVFRMNWNASVNDKARFDHPFVLEKRLVLNLTKRGILHNHQIGALAAQLLEMNTPGFVEYSKAVVSNAGTLAKALIAKGHKLAIGTTNYLVLWDLRPHGPTKSNVKRGCEACLDDDACISYLLFSISTNSSSQGSVSWVNPKCKAKDELLHGECRKKLVCASQLLTVCSSCCRHSTSRIPTCVRWSLILNLILCHLPLTGFPNRCLMSNSCALSEVSLDSLASQRQRHKVSSTIT